MAESGAGQGAIKVFVSYSRRDREFSDQLVLGLQACGFEAYIDREDIAAGEDWSARLGRLIEDADTVVYVMSPDSVNSEQCSWEVRETLRLSKRLLPVVWRPVPEDQTPPEMARLNYIFFSGDGHSFASGLAQLSEALRIDIDWIREHTRLAAAAARWNERGRSDAMVLRGEELDHAGAWAKSRPSGAPDITDLQADYIEAGVAARKAAERARRKGMMRLVFASSCVAVLMTGLAGGAVYLWQQSQEQTRLAEEAQVLEFQAREEADAARLAAENANLRLSANIGLRAPPSQSYLDVPGGWFQVAANYSGAIARFERRSEDGEVYQQASGVLLDGGLLNESYVGETFLLAPLIYNSGYESGGGGFGGPGMMANVFVPDELIFEEPAMIEEPAAIVEEPAAYEDRIAAAAPPPEIDFSDPELPPIAQTMISGADFLPDDHVLFASFPIMNDDNWIKASELIWETPMEMAAVTPFQLWKLETAPPPAIRPISETDVDCSDPYGFVAEEQLRNGEPPQKSWVAAFGVDAGGSAYSGENAVTLFVSALIDRSDPYELRYDHATALGAAGGPVFDIENGKIFAIHIGSEPDFERKGRRIGLGISLPMVINIARQEIGPREGYLAPLCEVEE